MSSTPTASPRGAAHTARLLLSCPDGPGIVAAVTGFLYERGANIVASDQYSTHPEHGTLFMRTAFYLPTIRNPNDRSEFERAFGAVAARFGMRWRLADAAALKRVALLASREGHCLLDLLWRARNQELEMDVVCSISNHDELRAQVEALGCPFHHVPVDAGGKPRAEARMLELLRGRVDLVVLARYMQILSAGFLDAVGCPVINIHHSCVRRGGAVPPGVRARGQADRRDRPLRHRGARRRADRRPGRAARRARVHGRGPGPGRARPGAHGARTRAAAAPRRPRARPRRPHDRLLRTRTATAGGERPGGGQATRAAPV